MVLVHLQTNHMYALNRTATRVWELLAVGCDQAQIQQQLLQEFDVDETHLAGEIETLFASLIDAHLLSAYISE